MESQLLVVKEPLTVWEAFVWSQARKNKLPSEHSRMNDPSLRTHDESKTGLSTMVHSIDSAVVHTAEVLYPTNPDLLHEDIAFILGQNLYSTSTKDDNKIVVNMNMIMNASNKC